MDDRGETDRRHVRYDGTSKGDQLNMIWHEKQERAACASILTAIQTKHKVTLNNHA